MDARAPTLRAVDPLERETITRVGWRLLPLLMLGLFCAFLNRTNVGMAAPTMNPDPGFSNEMFDFGACLFFFGHFLGEVPSKLILNEVGARRRLARIMLTWSIVAGLTAFVWNDWSYYGICIILGLIEAGFFPGVVLYLIWWFPTCYRSRMLGVFCSTVVTSLVIGPPIGGLLLHLSGTLGLQGWQSLFLIEAVPPIIMAVLMWNLLTDRPTEASRLRPDQRTWLGERLASEKSQHESVHKLFARRDVLQPEGWLLTIANFGSTMAGLGVTFFMPLIVKGLGVPTNSIGVVSAGPFVFALVALNYWGWHSDRAGERSRHAAATWLLVSAGMAACVVISTRHSLPCPDDGRTNFRDDGPRPPAFWAMTSYLLTGTTAAGGIAMINAVGQLDGWFGPSVVRLVRDATGSNNMALLCLALGPVISAIAVLAAGYGRRAEGMSPRP